MSPALLTSQKLLACSPAISLQRCYSTYIRGPNLSKNTWNSRTISRLLYRNPSDEPNRYGTNIKRVSCCKKRCVAYTGKYQLTPRDKNTYFWYISPRDMNGIFIVRARWNLGHSRTGVLLTSGMVRCCDNLGQKRSSRGTLVEEYSSRTKTTSTTDF
jgi:hypothetical protein